MEVVMVYKQVVFFCLLFSYLTTVYSCTFVTHNVCDYSCYVAGYKDVLHKLLYVWEEMRVLINGISPVDTHRCFFDTIADNIMEIHDLVTADLSDSTCMYEEREDTWLECMHILIPLISQLYLFAKDDARQKSINLYMRIQGLNDALYDQVAIARNSMLARSDR
jgi:hypothetical protein